MKSKLMMGPMLLVLLLALFATPASADVQCGTRYDCSAKGAPGVDCGSGELMRDTTACGQCEVQFCLQASFLDDQYAPSYDACADKYGACMDRCCDNGACYTGGFLGCYGSQGCWDSCGNCFTDVYDAHEGACKYQPVKKLNDCRLANGCGF